MHERSHPRIGDCIFFNIYFNQFSFWIVNFEYCTTIFQVHDSETQFAQANAKKTRFNFIWKHWKKNLEKRKKGGLLRYTSPWEIYFHYPIFEGLWAETVVLNV
jgi:hypothetical protein